jgi:hypothetical protein
LLQVTRSTCAIDQSKGPSKQNVERTFLGVQPAHHLLQSKIPPQKGETMCKEQIGKQKSQVSDEPNESQAKISMGNGKET